MRKELKKLFVIIGLSLLVCSSVFAEGSSAKVTFVRGKVEVQRQDGNWYPLEIGDVVNEAETISTGFYSDLKLEYNSSIIALGALTRVTLENLSSSTEKDNVSLYLNTGAVRSKVNHTKERRVSYVVKTPVAVASVRGTDFTVTAKGEITCNEGAVVVFPNVEKHNTAVKNNAKEDSEEESSEDEEESSEPITEAVAIAESVETTDASSEVETTGDYGSATPTTAAREIANDAPAGAIVVGKAQTVSITVVGTTETPIATATKKSQQAKTVVATAATQEAEVVGSVTVADAATTKEIKTAVETLVSKPAKINVEIVLQD